MLECPLDPVDRSERHALAGENLSPVCGSRSGEEVGEKVDEDRTVSDAGSVVGVKWGDWEVWARDGLAERDKLGIVSGCQL